MIVRQFSTYFAQMMMIGMSHAHDVAQQGTVPRCFSEALTATITNTAGLAALQSFGNLSICALDCMVHQPVCILVMRLLAHVCCQSDLCFCLDIALGLSGNGLGRSCFEVELFRVSWGHLVMHTHSSFPTQRAAPVCTQALFWGCARHTEQTSVALCGQAVSTCVVGGTTCTDYYCKQQLLSLNARLRCAFFRPRASCMHACLHTVHSLCTLVGP